MTLPRMAYIFRPPILTLQCFWLKGKKGGFFFPDLQRIQYQKDIFS